MFGNPMGEGLDMNLVTAQMHRGTAVPMDQRTNTLQMAPSAVATRAIGPATDMAQLTERGTIPMLTGDPNTGGGGTSIGPAPGCLTAAQVALIVNCAANPSPGCEGLLASSGLPLCASEKLPLPPCRDDQMAASISYCDQYGPNGPDAGKNGVCWAAMKDAAWYAAMKGLAPCPDSEGAKKKKMLMWGGIILAVAAVGGVGYWYATKKD